MAEFGADKTMLSNPSGVSGISAPVVDNSSAIRTAGIVGGIGSIAKAGVDLLDMFAEKDKEAKKAELESRKQNLVADMSNSLTAIQQNIIAGTYSPTEGKVRSQSLINKTISANPDLATTILENYKGITGDTLVSQTQQEKQQEAMISAAAKRGLVDPSKLSDPLYQQDVVQRYNELIVSEEQMKQSNARLTQANALLTQQSKLTGLQIQQLNLAKQQAERQSAMALDNYTDSFMPNVEGALDSAYEEARRSGDPSKLKAIVEEQKRAYQQEVMKRMSPHASPSVVQGRLNLFNSYADSYLEGVDNQETLQHVQNRLKLRQANGAQILLDKFPQTEAMFALNYVAPALMQSDGMRLLAPEAARRIFETDFSKPLDSLTFDQVKGNDSGTKGDKGGALTIFDAFSADVSETNKVLENPQTRPAVARSYNTLFKSIDIYKMRADDPNMYDKVVSSFKNPNTAKIVNTLGDELNADFKQGARDTIQQQLVDIILPNLAENIQQPSFFKHMFAVMPDADAFYRNKGVAPSAMLKTEVDSNGTFKFVLDDSKLPSLKDDDIFGNNLALRTATQRGVQELNRKVATRINDYIKMVAHLDGSTQYGSYGTLVNNRLSTLMPSIMEQGEQDE
jgi:hypothetical protein